MNFNFIESYKTYISLFLVCLILAGAGMILYAKTTQPDSLLGEEKIKVEILGAVKNPGVYEMSEGDRVSDLIAQAGGLLREANLGAMKISQASQLIDGQRVYIPGLVETVSQAKNSDKININTASLAELDSLPGVGEVIAQRIIDYRTQNGPFQTIEEIKNVSGIGDKKFEDLKNLITVR